MSLNKSTSVPDMFTSDFARYFEVAGSLIQEQQKQLESAIPNPPLPPILLVQPASLVAKPPGEQPRIATLVYDLKTKLTQLENELHRSPKGQELKRQMDFALAKFSSPDLTIALEALKSLNAIFNRDDEIVWTFWPYLHGKSDQLVLLCARQFRLFLTHHYTPEKFTSTDGTGRRQLFNLIQHNTELLLHMILSPTKIGRQISRESFHELLQTLLPYLVIHESSDKKYLFQAITSLLNTLLTVQYDPKTGKNYFYFDHTKLVVVLVRLIRDFHQALFAKPASSVIPKYLNELQKLLSQSLANIKLKWSRDGQRVHLYMNLDIVMYEFYNFYEFYSKTTSLDWHYKSLDTMRSYMDFIFIAEQDDIWDYTSLINKELTIAKRAHKSSLLVLYMKNHATPSPHHLQPSKIKDVAKETVKSAAPLPPQPAEKAKVNPLMPLTAMHACPSNDPEVRFAFIQAQFDAARKEYAKHYYNLQPPIHQMMTMTGQMMSKDVGSQQSFYDIDRQIQAMPVMQMIPAKPAQVMATRPAPAVPSPSTVIPLAVSKPAAPVTTMTEHISSVIKPTEAVVKISAELKSAPASVETGTIESKPVLVATETSQTKSKTEPTETEQEKVPEAETRQLSIMADNDQLNTEDEVESMDMEVISLEDCTTKSDDHQMDADSDCSSSTSSSSYSSTSSTSSRLSSHDSSFEVIDTDFTSELTAEQSSLVEVIEVADNSAKQPQAPALPNQTELFQCVQSLQADLLKSQAMISKLVEQLTEQTKI